MVFGEKSDLEKCPRIGRQHVPDSSLDEAAQLQLY